MAKRTKCIEPMQALGSIATAVSDARERLWESTPVTASYDKRAAFVDRNINLLEIREVVAVEMARNGFVFDSGYRHEVSELHSVVASDFNP